MDGVSTMKCPRCEVAFHAKDEDWEWARYESNDNYPHYWVCLITECPECRVPIIRLDDHEKPSGHRRQSLVIYPTAAAPPVENDPMIPNHLAVDFSEAATVLPISAKASAALSRRILQSVLTENGYSSTNLASQIDALLSDQSPDKVPPSYLRNKVDVIRNFGNFSAHEQKSIATSEIIDVEPQEAEWCLEIVSALFDHYYIRPAEDQKKLDNLNQKLASAGKPPSK